MLAASKQIPATLSPTEHEIAAGFVSGNFNPSTGNSIAAMFENPISSGLVANSILLVSRLLLLQALPCSRPCRNPPLGSR
jgi:hypothetical protein